MEILKKNAANLLKVKTIVTLALTLVFCILALCDKIDKGDFMTVFTVVIAFYFGTQAEKLTTAAKSTYTGAQQSGETVAEYVDTQTGNEMQPEAAMDTLQPPDEMAPVGIKY